MRSFPLVVFLVLTAVARPTRADEPVPGAEGAFTEEELATRRARTAFRRGNEQVAQSEWAAALESFEESFQLRPHPVTQYNVGVAQRALGQYTRARRSFRAALEAQGDALPSSLQEQARALLEEVEKIVVHVKLTVKPSIADLAVDGRPLEREGENVQAAGILPAGRESRSAKGLSTSSSTLARTSSCSRAAGSPTRS